MGISITVHCRCDGGLPQVVSVLEELIGHGLTRDASVGWELYIGFSLGIDLSVYRSEFIDDCGIAFSEYEFVIDLDPGAVPLPDGDGRSNFAAAFATVVAFQCASAGCQCIVVRDMQEMLRRVP